MRSLAIILLATAALGCEHELETSCISGDCAPYAPPQAVVDMGDCLDACDITTVSGNTGNYPCEVEEIMTNVCTNCHVDGGSGPFPLTTYEESQELYAGEAIWSRIPAALANDFMPLGGPPLNDTQKASMVDDWACQCGIPRDAAEQCN